MVRHRYLLANRAARCHKKQRNLARLSCQQRHRRALWPTPVNTFQKHRKLRRGEADFADPGHRPYEPPTIHTLGKQAQALTIIPQQLNEITALAPEGEQSATMRVLVQYLLRQYRKAIEALPHIGRTAGKIDAGRGR